MAVLYVVLLIASLVVLERGRRSRQTARLRAERDAVHARIARLEAWHRYHTAGCYDGQCRHEQPKAVVRGVRPPPTVLTSGDFDHLIYKRCELADRRTWANRFPYLDDWLSDVSAMLRAGDDLLEAARVVPDR